MFIIANRRADPVPLRVSLAGKWEHLTLQPGHRWLVCGDATLSGDAVERGAVDLQPFDPSGLSKVLAHIDNTRGTTRMGGEPSPLVLPVPFEADGHAERWFIDQLARAPGQGEADRLEMLIQHLSRTQSYGLVRFILEQGPEYSIAALAKRYGLSLAQFNRCCRKALGGSLKRELRVLRAARALLEYTSTNCSLTHLAANHGYASLSHFCTEIKTLVGHSPLSVYRAVAPPSSKPCVARSY